MTWYLSAWRIGVIWLLTALIFGHLGITIWRCCRDLPPDDGDYCRRLSVFALLAAKSLNINYCSIDYCSVTEMRICDSRGWLLSVSSYLCWSRYAYSACSCCGLGGLFRNSACRGICDIVAYLASDGPIISFLAAWCNTGVNSVFILTLHFNAYGRSIDVIISVAVLFPGHLARDWPSTHPARYYCSWWPVPDSCDPIHCFFRAETVLRYRCSVLWRNDLILKWWPLTISYLLLMTGVFRYDDGRILLYYSASAIDVVGRGIVRLLTDDLLLTQYWRFLHYFGNVVIVVVHWRRDNLLLVMTWWLNLMTCPWRLFGWYRWRRPTQLVMPSFRFPRYCSASINFTRCCCDYCLGNCSVDSLFTVDIPVVAVMKSSPGMLIHVVMFLTNCSFASIISSDRCLGHSFVVIPRDDAIPLVIVYAHARDDRDPDTIFMRWLSIIGTIVHCSRRRDPHTTFGIVDRLCFLFVTWWCCCSVLFAWAGINVIDCNRWYCYTCRDVHWCCDDRIAVYHIEDSMTRDGGIVDRCCWYRCFYWYELCYWCYCW